MSIETVIAPIAPYFAGMINGTFGYLIAKFKNGEAFDAKNFLTSTVVGGIVGGIGTAMHVDFSTASGFSIIQFATFVADKVVGIYQKEKSAIANALAANKANAPVTPAK